MLYVKHDFRQNLRTDCHVWLHAVKNFCLQILYFFAIRVKVGIVELHVSPFSSYGFR